MYMLKKAGSNADERNLSYTEWMMKIQSVYYGCDVELDKGIARDMQHSLAKSK